MSVSKLNKEIGKLVVEEEHRATPSRSRETFLISDSKGRFIEREITPKYYGELRIISRSGATIDDFNFRRQFLTNIRLANHPLVFIWFGTCELTNKKGKFIETAFEENIFEKVDQLIVKYRYLKSDISRCNRHAKIIFLKCPYYSIVEWNRHKGCNDLQAYAGQETTLFSSIDYLNQKLDELNNTLTPNLSQDIIRSSKRKSDKKVKYTKNFNLYLDGIHPGTHLSLLWLHKILKIKHQVECSEESSN